MIFNIKKHNAYLYNTLLSLSRNLFFYNEVGLKDNFETRIYLMFFHFSVILQIFKFKKTKFDQTIYDNLFFSIENNLRELGYGDVAVNKKMKDLNKIFYDILLKFNNLEDAFQLKKSLVLKYFPDFEKNEAKKYEFFEDYFIEFYNFCFELQCETMLKEAINFRGK